MSAIGDFFRRLVGRMTGEKQMVEEKLQVQIATSSVMDNAIDLWKQMYKNRPPWIGGDDHVVPLNLPAAISEEMARLILTEFEFDVSGDNERAEFIGSQMDIFLDGLSATMEIWAAMGGVAIKPYVASSVDGGPLDRIRLDIIQADRFFPTAFSSNGDVTGAVFVESKRVGEYLYTRLEHHNLEGTTYTVTNRAFRSEKIANVGAEDDQLTASNPFRDEVPLSSVDTWAGLEPETVINGVERPLFVYIRVPRGNNIDTESPLGASVYSRAVDTIREADIQFSRILWEYRATEAAIDADASLFMSDRNGQPILPEGNDRLFRAFDFGGTNNAGFIKEYAPAIRDSALFNGLNEMARKIEFQCGLAYGTISDLNDVQKTAEEIKSSKQRSFSTVSRMQKAWNAGLEKIVYIMDAYCSLYNLAPAGEIEMSATWGDGVLEDSEKEYQRRWNMVVAGKYRLDKFLAWYFGTSEEEAAELIPAEATSFYPPIE